MSELRSIAQILEPKDRSHLEAYFEKSNDFHISGLGLNKQAVIETFFERVVSRQIPGLSIGFGPLVLGKEKKAYDCYGLTRSLGEAGELAVMVLRFDALGNDLTAEWRHYEMGKKHDAGWKLAMWTVGLLSVVLAGSLVTIIPAYMAFASLARGKAQDPTEEQKRVSWTFRESIDSALREAFEVCHG